jgi:hypothetical protein
MGQVSGEHSAALSASVSVAGGRKAIGHLTVIAGPTAVGKSHLIRMLAEHDSLREQMAVAKDAPAFAAGELLKLPRVGTIDHLVLHYDILRPFIKGFPSHELDPGTAVFWTADQITFLTLRTTPERLRARLESRYASSPRKRLRRLRPLYTDDRFLADWYGRWLASVQLYRDVTAEHYFVEAHDGYALTPVEGSI